MPRVSVIIPCYNLGEFLEEAIESVKAQSFMDYEIIVVDDGSDDSETQALLSVLANAGLHVLRTENHGVAAARNCGISAAQGEYILPLDADDRIGHDYLCQAVAVLDQRPEVGIVYCWSHLFGELSGPWELPKFSVAHHLIDNLIFSSAFFRRNDWQAVDGYNERMLAGWEDWDFWTRLIGLGCDVVQLPTTQFFYRIRCGSRERSLGIVDKFQLIIGMLCRHRRLYWRHARKIMRILLVGDRRPPGSIKVA